MFYIECLTWFISYGYPKRQSTLPKHGFLIAYVHSALEIVILTHINLYNNLAKKYNMHIDIFQAPCSIMQITKFLNMVITQCNHFKVH